MQCTDALTGNQIVLRADLIFKIEEYTNEAGLSCRRIQFIDGSVEYIADTMNELLDAIVNIQDV